MGDKIIKCEYHPKEIIYTKWSGKLYTALQTSESTGEKNVLYYPHHIRYIIILKTQKLNISKLSFLIKCSAHLSPGHIRTGTANELSGIIIISLSSLSIATSFTTEICLRRECIQITAGNRKLCHGRFSVGAMEVRSRGLRKYYCLLTFPCNAKWIPILLPVRNRSGYEIKLLQFWNAFILTVESSDIVLSKQNNKRMYNIPNKYQE